MRLSSSSIGQLAGALAKAQAELTNPVKSLPATLDESGRGGGKSYRYAPLSAGLDIVRKTLSQHALAAVQTTYVDDQQGLVTLTTTLAHESGEWISAVWPICRLSALDDPKLMGAALTYARRYGLFTLVGLAGEDDLDAPPARPARHGIRNQGQIDVAGPNCVPGLSGDQMSAGWDAAGTAESLTTPHDYTEQEPKQRLRLERSRTSLETVTHDTAVAALSAVQDADALLRWAREAMPVRRALSGEERDALDAAFLVKAEEVAADPEVLVAFSVQAPAGPDAGSSISDAATA
ncbi:ERF family protein [Methylobacterium oryzisoli]|uniref:ERF family protein n=1 Tax=Methylobacterium oryzisoli TaxID=3385502 RepID=UPI00389207AA